ncbi:MAG: hypothetical protein NT098_05190 [Candidatus Parcubacteria bacterium]|nr:hypothetical protein [Candidatus Parcubacteria bacterium]
MALKKIAISVLLAFLVSSLVFANDQNEPFFKSGDAQCSIWGYASFTVGPEQDFMGAPIRTRTSCTYKKFSFFMENDLSGLDSRIPANYITQAWVGYNFGKEGLIGNFFSNTTIRAGSLITAGGLYLPPAFMAVSIKSPNNPFQSFGYGVQVETKVTPTLTFIGDVTGATGPAFNDPKRFDRTETSQRLIWDAVKDNTTGQPKLQLSVSNQWSNESQRIGFGAMYRATKDLDLYGGVYHNDEHPRTGKASTGNGGYALIDYKLWGMEGNKLDLRVMGLFNKAVGDTEYTSYSAGPSLILPKEGGYGRFGGSSVTVDFSHSNTKTTDGPEVSDNAIMTRVRIFF